MYAERERERERERETQTQREIERQLNQLIREGISLSFAPVHAYTWLHAFLLPNTVNATL